MQLREIGKIGEMGEIGKSGEIVVKKAFEGKSGGGNKGKKGKLEEIEVNGPFFKIYWIFSADLLKLSSKKELEESEGESFKIGVEFEESEYKGGNSLLGEIRNEKGIR